jgi:peptidoglycan/xylan/chitin deacetylase (PgdA/CDA1 family)
MLAAPSRRSRRGHALAWALVAVAIVGTSVLVVQERAERAALAKAAKKQPGPYPGARGVRGLVPVLPDARLAQPVAITLVRDPASAGYYDDPSAYDSALVRWRRELEAVGARVTVRTPRQLAATHEPLVVAAAPCLSVETRKAMTRAAESGTGLLVTWLTGTRDAGCRAVGWGFLASITGAGQMDTLGIADAANITVTAGNGLALGVPPGARVELRGANHVALRAATRDAHYSDAWLNPSPVRGAPLLDGAIARGVQPRVAFVGFELRDVADEAWSRGITQLLVRNVVAHIAGVPQAAVEPWPGGHRAAAVLAQDVEDEYANASAALDTLRSIGVRSTFFVVSNLARENDALTRELARSGELGSHSEDHRRLGGAPANVQATRLERTHSDLVELAGGSVAGLRPPEEQFDAATLAGWRAAGGSYVFASNDNRCACPELVELGGSPFVLMGRSVDDDFIEIRRAGTVEPRRLVATQLAGWKKVHALGGLYILSYHSNMLARPASVGALGMVARALRADTSAWLVTTGDVAEWWQARHAVSTVVERRGEGVVVRVHNGGGTTVAAFGVLLSLPDGRRPRNGATAVAGGGRIAVPSLAAGETREFAIALEATAHAR